MSKELPQYSVLEERLNFITHFIGVILSVFGFFYCLKLSLGKNDTWGLVSGGIFTISMIILYSMSSVYHGAKNEGIKAVFRKLDHASIFLLIAGSYTPILMSSLRVKYPKIAWTLLGVIWAVTILGMVLNFISVKRFAKFSMICYIAMGWCIVIALKPMLDSIELKGFLMILAGGICYTIGAVLYGIGKRKVQYMHAVFHLFVLAGNILQFLAVIWYIL